MLDWVLMELMRELCFLLLWTYTENVATRYLNRFVIESFHCIVINLCWSVVPGYMNQWGHDCFSFFSIYLYQLFWLLWFQHTAHSELLILYYECLISLVFWFNEWQQWEIDSIQWPKGWSILQIWIIEITKTL